MLIDSTQALETFWATHPTATKATVTMVTRKMVYIRYERPDLGAMGLYVLARTPKAATGAAAREMI